MDDTAFFVALCVKQFFFFLNRCRGRLTQWVSALFFLGLSPWALPSLTGQSVVDAYVYDAGQYLEDSLVLSHRFVFENTDLLPLSIDSLRVSCPCLRVIPPIQPVPMGEKAELIVHYDIENRPGSFVHYVDMIGNNNHYIKRFTLRGEIIPGEKQAPQLYPFKQGPVLLLREVVHFDTLFDEANSLAPRSFFLYNHSADTLSFDTEGLPSHLEVSFQPPLLPPHKVGKWEVRCFLEKRKEVGFQLDQLLVYARTKEKKDSLVVLVASTKASTRAIYQDAEVVPSLPSVQTEAKGKKAAGAKGPRLFFSARSYDFGLVKPYEALIATFDLENRGDEPLQLFRFQDFCNCIYVKSKSLVIPPNSKEEILIFVDAQHLEGRQKQRLYIHTNDPKEPILELKVLFEVND